jgi:hypothetical protein
MFNIMFKNVLIALVSAFLLTACQPKEESKQTDSAATEVKSDIPWQKGEKITEAVDTYFNTNVYEKGKENLALDHNGTAIEAAITKINKENIMQTSEKEGVAEVMMTSTSGEELIADFFLTWNPDLPATTEAVPGGFVVQNVTLRQVKDTKLYSWEKSGKFFVKK